MADDPSGPPLDPSSTHPTDPPSSPPPSLPPTPHPDSSSDPTLRRILSSICPKRTVESVTPIEAGNRKRTEIVRFRQADAEAVVVQRTPDPEAARLSATLLDAIADRTSVPVAPLVASGTAGGEGWLATALVEGRDLHELFAEFPADIQRRLAAAFGRHLADLHEQFTFDGYGRLGVTDGRLSATRSADDAAGWRGWFQAFAETAIDRLPSAFDPIRARLVEAVGTAILDEPTPRLFPWDFRPGNALVTDSRLAAIFDWEGPLAADPALSVAKTELLVADWYVPPDRTQALRRAFREGYATVRSLPSVQPAHRVAAIADTAVDSRGAVTTPGYPPVDRSAAIEFHRRLFDRVLSDDGRSGR